MTTINWHAGLIGRVAEPEIQNLAALIESSPAGTFKAMIEVGDGKLFTEVLGVQIDCPEHPGKVNIVRIGPRVFYRDGVKSGFQFGNEGDHLPASAFPLDTLEVQMGHVGDKKMWLFKDGLHKGPHHGLLVFEGEVSTDYSLD